MSTLELLFGQIFERKDWIEGQLRMQIDSYNQSLAYNLIADGGRPPPWLWTAGQDASAFPDTKELNREQLISEILLPLPRTTMPVTNYNALFTLPALKGGHVSHPNSFFTETCALSTSFKPDQRDKEVPTSEPNGSERDLDVRVESEVVEGCADIDSFARIQRSRSRQRDLEIRLNKKAKTSDHLGEEGTTDGYIGRMTRSRVASAKADCVKKSSESLVLQDEDSDRVVQSRSTQEKLDCLHKSLNPSKPLEWVEDATQKATETEIDCGPVPPVNVESLAPDNLDDVAPDRCATENVANELVPDAAHSVHSCLKISAVASELSETLSLIEPKKLLFDGIEECGLNKKPAYVSEQENQGCSPETTLTKLEVVQSVKADSCGDFMKVNGSLESKKLLKEDVLHTAGSFCRTEENDPISNGGPEERAGLHEIEDSQCFFQPTSSNRCFEIPALSPKKVTCLISENASTSTSSIRVSMLNSGGVQQEVSRKSLSGGLVNYRMKEQCSGKIIKELASVLACGTPETNILEETKHFVFDSTRKRNLNMNSVDALKNDPEGSSTEIDSKNLETMQSLKEGYFCTDATSEHVSLDHSQLQIEDVFLNAEVTSTEEIEVSGGGQKDRLELLETMESECYSHRTSCNSKPSKLLAMPSLNVKSGSSGNARNNSSIVKDCMLRSFNISDNYNKKLPLGSPLECTTGQNCMERLIKETSDSLVQLENYVLSKTDVNEAYVGLKDVAKKRAVRQTMTTNSIETQNTRPKAQYFLRSLTGQDKNVVSTNWNNDASDSKQTMETTARACAITWPKKKKIGGRSNNLLATSPRLRRKPLSHIQDGSDCIFKTTKRNGSGALMEHQPFSLLSEMKTDISNAAFKSSLEILHESKKRRITEGDLYLKGKNQAVMIPLSSERTKQESVPDLDGNFRTCLKEQVKATELSVLKQKEQCTSNDGHNFLHAENTLECETPQSSCYYEEFNKVREMRDEEKSLATQCTDGLSQYYDDLVGYDESIPEFEGFSVGVPSIMADGIVFNETDIPRLRKERVSLLEQHCRSRNMLTPGSLPFSKHNIHKVPELYQSLPFGLLEHMNLSNSFQYSDVDMKQFRASENGWLSGLRCNLGSEYDDSFVERSCSDGMPSSSSRSGSEARKPPLTPPVEKFGHRVVSRRSGPSLEKVGSNPELACFRIDEDSSSTEGYGYLDELDTFDEIVGSRGSRFSINRNALVDVTALYHNSPQLVSVSKKFLESDIESVHTESFLGTQMELGNGYPSNKKSKVDDKENLVLSVSGKRVCKAADFLRNRSSKLKISVKANERNRSQASLVKGCKPNNILSNKSSFIPLKREKQQEAAPVKGKKDLKVKALEAAEAAKRLEEKKQNERRARKALIKLERERLEQENVKRLELKIKEKEEKRNKDANTDARKRHREEMTEKERKRRCIEETCRHQRVQEERLRADKEKKGFRHKDADENERRKKELEEAKRELKPEKGEVAGWMKAAEVEPCATKVVSEDARPQSYNLEAHDASKTSNDIEKVVHNSDGLQEANQDGNTIMKECQDYEMSPYVDSDEEDGEEERRRKRKYIPLWARRESLDQILLSTKDPSEIFRRKRSFNLSEVLLPHTRRRPL